MVTRRRGPRFDSAVAHYVFGTVPARDKGRTVMHLRGVSPQDVEDAVCAVSTALYNGNVRTYELRGDGLKRSPGTRFCIRPEDSHGPGSRWGDTGGSGRAVWACSYGAHGYVMAELFHRFPTARLQSATSDYRGADDFHAQTGHQFHPVSTLGVEA